MNLKKISITATLFVVSVGTAFAASSVTTKELPVGNPSGTFERAKTQLSKIYDGKKMERVEAYCSCQFGSDKKTKSGSGCAYVPTTKTNRGKTIEWEHVVPAENFGKNFTEWTNGNASCTKRKLKGRDCAGTNKEFQKMEGDLYNLYPAIGELNAIRSNHPYGRFDMYDAPNAKYFAGCDAGFNTETKRFMPPEKMRGELARVMLYFEKAYPSKYSIPESERRMVNSWNKAYPVTEKECKRYEEIKKIQKSENPILKSRCSTVKK